MIKNEKFPFKNLLQNNNLSISLQPVNNGRGRFKDIIKHHEKGNTSGKLQTGLF